MASVLYVIVGLAGGVLGGLIGIGGATMIIPVLVFLFGFSEHRAQGTTLAMMVPPIGLLAAWTYYKEGYADLRVAGLIAVGFFVGGLFGAKLAVIIPNAVLQKVFGVALVVIGIKMVIGR
jgi:uncharacterized membrane protein YfcA